MFLNKFFHFFKGYVILKLTGFNIERFLYICARRGIIMWDIKKSRKDCAYIAVSISDFFRIRPIAYKTRTKVHIKSKAGLPILFKKYKKRYFMLFGCIFFVLMICVSAQFIWTVEITGVENADIVKITKILEDCGIHAGAFKGSALPAGEIKNILINKVDNISWAWVYLKGTKAVCEIFEESIPGAPLEDGEPCDIIAAKDGIIKRIIAKDGVKIAAAGDTVMAGDVLISGMVLNDAGEVGCTVSASGTVEAHTWHEKKNTYKLYYETREPTGNSRTFNTINIFSKSFNLFLNDSIAYKDYDLKQNVYELKLFKDMYLGVSLKRVKALEVNVNRQPISYDMAVYEGKCDLEEKIAKELLPGAELVSQNVSHRQVDDETVEVTLTMEFIEKIGTKAPIRNIYETEKQE